MKFVQDTPASRVVFGNGAIERIPEEVIALSGTRVMVFASRRDETTVNEIVAALGQLHAGTFQDVQMHVPVDIARMATDSSVVLGADVLLAFGGGSAIGTAKAVARETGLPILAVPTTYSGSEMTPIWGITADGRKETGRDLRVLPKTVIYDPVLTLTLPPELSASSGMNALAHSVEGLYAPGTSPLLKMQAQESVRALAAALPTVVTAPQDLEARNEALYGAWLAGWTLGTSVMGIHHKICHTLGGTFNMPHAQTHSAVLAYAVRYNEEAAPEAMLRIRAALNEAGIQESTAARGLWTLAREIGAPTSLSEAGFQTEWIDEAADIVVAGAPVNPAPVTVEGVRRLLADAAAGERPS